MQGGMEKFCRLCPPAFFSHDGASHWPDPPGNWRVKEQLCGPLGQPPGTGQGRECREGGCKWGIISTASSTFGFSLLQGQSWGLQGINPGSTAETAVLTSFSAL